MIMIQGGAKVTSNQLHILGTCLYVLPVEKKMVYNLSFLVFFVINVLLSIMSLETIVQKFLKVHIIEG